MKTQTSSWLDPIIVLLFMTNALMLLHHLSLGSIVEQSAQVLAVLLFYGWLSQWVKRKV